MQELPAAAGFQCGQVQAQVLDLEDPAPVPAACARQQCLDPDFQFGQGEGLGQVVVGAGAEPGDLVG